MTINTEITLTPDVSMLAAAHAACFSKGWDARAFGDMLAIPGTSALLVRNDEGLQGFGILRILPGEAEVLTLAVLPEHRNRGIGHAIANAMCDSARIQGAKTMFLEVRESNRPAQAMYDKCGFAALSRRKGYYQNDDGSSEDAVVMRRAL